MIDLTIEAGDWHAQLPDLEALINRVIETAWDQLEPGRTADLSILLTDDAHQQILNRDWRGKDKPTNVLSFPGPPAPPPGQPGQPGQPWLLGDMSLAFETLIAEADRDGISAEDHLAHLLVHGLLHLLGHDHEEEAEAEAMEAMEIEILATMNIANPYKPSCGTGD